MPELIRVYQMLSERSDLPLHLGLTEAGMGMKGIVATTTALSPLLMEGIGDTVRVSLTPRPGGDRTEEVRVAQQVLQSLGIRSFEPQVTSCPGCGRTTSTLFQEMAEDIASYIREKMPEWRTIYPGVEELDVAVMGCVVNGPGESRHADLGISTSGHCRGSEGARVRGWSARRDPQRRRAGRGVQAHTGRLRGTPLREPASAGSYRFSQ